jgi:CP family cyanate transporter-like MFS transporter
VAAAGPTPSDDRVGRRIWRDPLAWWIAIYMGMQSWNFYVFATWLAPIELSRSVPPVVAGLDVMLFHVCGVLGSLAAPFLARTRLRPVLPVVPPALGILGALGIVLLPGTVPALWLALAGFSCGSALSISLTLMAQRAASHAASSALSGMAQSVGYLLAGLGPILFGLAHELTGGWLLPLAVVLLASVTGLTAGVAVRGTRRVLDPR